MTPRDLIIAVVVLLAGTVGLGFYTLHLKHAAQTPAAMADSRPLPPPVSAAPVQVRLVMANDTDGSLTTVPAQIVLPSDASRRPKEILRALVARYSDKSSLHPIGTGADINEVYVAGKLAIIDVNAAFADAHPSGILAEELTLGSLALTLASNLPDIEKVKVVVDGKERPTLAGHADLSEPYDVKSAALLIK